MRTLNRPKKQRKTLASHFAASVFAIAAVAAMASNAAAAIITTSTSIAVPNNFDGVYINLATGATSSTAFAGFDFNPYGSGNLLFYWGGGAGAGSLNAGVAATTSGPYLDLATGALVSSASTFSASANGANNETAAFLISGTHNLGLRFLNEATGIVNYGYLTLTTTGTSGFPATITGWSYENTGAGIVVGSATDGTVPEPSTIGMMAVGAMLVGLGERRQNRRKQAS